MKTIAEYWAFYRENSLPEDVPAEILESIRGVFYAGFSASMNFHHRWAHDQVPPESLNAIVAEMQAYSRSNPGQARH